MSPHLGTTKTHSLESGSENEIEQDPVLQPSSPVDALSPLDLYPREPSEATCQLPTHTAVASSTDPVMTAEPHENRASELPDLISFDMPTLPRPALPEFQPRTSPHSSLTPPSQLSSSSSATVDDLLTLSPIQSKHPLLQTQVPEVLSNDLDPEVAVTPSLSTPEPEASYRKGVSAKIEGCLSEVMMDIDSVPVQITFPISPLPSADDIDDSPLQLETTTSNTADDICTAHLSDVEDRQATPAVKVLDPAANHTPQQAAISLPSTFPVETRKRSPANGLKGKEKVHDCGNSSNESFNNTSSESLSSLGNGEIASDKAAKKERRVNSRREATHKRQQLLSLSPTSVNVLSLLASPDRDSPARPIGLDGVVSDFAMDPDPLNGSSPVEPETPRINAARRVSISASSSRRIDGSPLRFIVPSPINLNSPIRTPARRILLSSSSQTSCLLPIDDPNRIPARRVAIQPSPTKPAEATEPLAPRIRVEESSPVKQILPSSAKSSIQPTSSNLHDKATPLSSSLSPAFGVSKPLPFPIRRNVTGETTAMTSVRASRPNTDSGTAKAHPVSNLRQPSSISTSKIARIATKPYTRTAQGPSRLPITSFMRSLGPIASTSSASTTTSAGPNRSHLSPANIAVRHLIRSL